MATRKARKPIPKAGVDIGGELSPIDVHVEKGDLSRVTTSHNKYGYARYDTYYGVSESQERAVRAVNKFKTMLPLFNSLAKAMTGDPTVKVILGTQSATDGKIIYLKPRIELGDIKPGAHPDRRVCGSRNEHLTQVCEVCAIEEEAIATLYHELSHIIENSFAAITDKDAKAVLAAVLAERGTEAGTARADKLAKRLEILKPDTYVDASDLISPYMKFILNVWEDAWVNQKLFDGRPGTKPMFDSKMFKIFTDGIVQDDGTVTKWSEADVTSQAMVGLLAKASGYDYSDWFVPEIVEWLNSPEVNKLVFQFRTSRSVKARYRLAFPTLEAIRSRGWGKRPDDVEDDPKPEPGGEEGQTGEPSEAGTSTGQTGSSAGQGQAGGQSGQPGMSQPMDRLSDEAWEEHAVPVPTSDTDKEDDTDESQDGAPEGQAGEDAGEEDEGGDAEPDDSAVGDSEDTGSGDWLDSYHTDPDDDDSDDESDSDSGDDGSGSSEDDGSGDVEADADESESGDGRGCGDQPDGAGSGDEGGEEGEPAGPEPEELDALIKKFSGHEDNKGSGVGTYGHDDTDLEINRAIVQGDTFDAPSENIFGVQLHRYNGPTSDYASRQGWRTRPATEETGYSTWNYRAGGDPSEVKAPESILSPALLKMRSVFSNNRKANPQHNHKSGRVDTSNLARRIAVNDPRVFSKKRELGAKDWFVVLGADISGSTAGFHDAIWLIKQALMAQAELLNRVGIKFAVYAHSSGESVLGGGTAVDMYCIKEPTEPWGAAQRERLVMLTSCGGNLDGHTMEFYRKVADGSAAAGKVILYYTDGEMPAENYSEELAILKREIKECERRGYLLVGVGVGTDSPRAHGLDTIRLDEIQEVSQVVDGLKSRIVEQVGKKGAA